jgi:hypothetical protein
MLIANDLMSVFQSIQALPVLRDHGLKAIGSELLCRRYPAVQLCPTSIALWMNELA